MNTAFVIGNGVSRRGLDLTSLQSHGKIYGCNALYREYTPDVLISTDKPISEAIQQSGYPLNNKFYTRKPWENSGALKIPQDFYGFSSGPIAVAIASQTNHLIYMIGFDMGPIDGGRYNNYYADTEFYRKTGAEPVYTGNWVKQLKFIADRNPAKQFIRVVGSNTANVAEFNNIRNIQHLPMNAFLERINKPKDL